MVATDIGGHRPFAEAPLCTIVPPGPAALADAVRAHLARGDDELSRDAAESREWVARGFSLDAYAKRMVGFYAELLGVA